MRKRLVIFILILASSLSFVWSDSVSFVYGNTVSSVDFQTLPKVGTVFKDENNNVLIVSSSNEKAVVFEKISTHSQVEVGSQLTRKGHQHLLFLRTSLNHTSLGYSISTSLYPLRPLVLTGVAYSQKNKTYEGFYFTLGFESDIVLSKLWDTQFTLIEDGGITGWCTAGVLVKNAAYFVSSYGLSYRHYLGSFRWELGMSFLQGSYGFKFSSAFLGLGASL